jgi:hypothetical protein
MPYQDDLPNLFAELPNLIIAGYGDPTSLATITYTDVLSSTGDPHQAGIIANAQSQEAINDAVNQTMINNMAKEENKVFLAADAVMSYEGPLDPDMNVADIVAPVYGVSPTKVEAMVTEITGSTKALEESYAKPFYDMDIGQDIVVEPETIDITKPVPMAGDPGFNQAIDNYLSVPSLRLKSFGEPSGGLVITPAADLPGLTAAPYQDLPTSITASEMAAAGHPGFGKVTELLTGPAGAGVDVLGDVAGAAASVAGAVPGALYGGTGLTVEERAAANRLHREQQRAAASALAQQEAAKAGLFDVATGDQTGVISDDPDAVAQRALNDATMEGYFTELQRIFDNFQDYPLNPTSANTAMDNDYFLRMIKSYIDSPEGQGSMYAGFSPENILGGWGKNPRVVEIITDSEAKTGTTGEGQQITTVTTKTAEAPAGPLQGTLVDADTAWPILNKMRDSQDDTYDYFVSPEGRQLWADQEKNLWGTQRGPDGTDQLISYGAMVKGITQANGTQYTLGGHTWLHNPDNTAMPWQIQGAQPAAAMGGGGVLPVQSTLGGMTPTKQWETLRAQEMGEDIWNPVRWGTRMQGFQPAYGQWLLSGQQFASPFHEFVQSGAAPDTAQGWQELVQASAGLTSPLDITGVDPMALGRQIGYGGLLQGDAGRTNAILMASAAMGAGQGMGAQALRGQLGSMYDVHAAQAAAAGQPAGGFIDWLNQQITPGSMPGTGL